MFSWLKRKLTKNYTEVPLIILTFDYKLVALYYDEDLSMAEIAKIYKCATSTIENLIKGYKIKVKPQLREIITKRKLNNLYHKQGKTALEISEMYNCSSGRIYKIMEFYGIKRRVRDDYIEYGFQFESITKEIFEVLYPHYKYHCSDIEGIIPDFYDAENNIVLDAKLSSFTPFCSPDFFDKYSICDCVIIIYLRGDYINYDEKFLWRHISFYYPELKEIQREDLIYKVEQLEVKLANHTPKKDLN